MAGFLFKFFLKKGTVIVVQSGQEKTIKKPSGGPNLKQIFADKGVHLRTLAVLHRHLEAGLWDENIGSVLKKVPVSKTLARAREKLPVRKNQVYNFTVTGN